MNEDLCKQASDLLEGKKLKRIWRSGNSIGIEFFDGSRLFIDTKNENIELSVTGVE